MRDLFLTSSTDKLLSIPGHSHLCSSWSKLAERAAGMDLEDVRSGFVVFLLKSVGSGRLSVSHHSYPFRKIAVGF